MQFYEREFLLSRIRAGYIVYKDKGVKLYIYHPDKDINYEAQELFVEKYNEGIELGMLDDNGIKNLLILNNMWSDQDEEELTVVLPKHVEEWKVKLYEARLNTTEQKRIRKYLKAAKDELDRKHQIRRSLDYSTIEGYASYCRWVFIISRCTKFPDKTDYDWQKASIPVLMNHFHKNSASEVQIRDLSKNPPWSTIWRANNGHHFFCADALDLTTEQASLLNWSSYYDSIQQAPDCPSDKIIEDDDMMDGWLIIKRREREREQAKALIESKTRGDAQEYFIPVGTREDADQVNSLNDVLAKNVVRQRIKRVERDGEVKVQHFDDIKQRVVMEATNKFKDTVKGMKNG